MSNFIVEDRLKLHCSSFSLKHKYSRLWRVYAVFEWKLKVERKPVRHDEVLGPSRVNDSTSTGIGCTG